jgi:LuxR family maltose regulon positive regulatory protein
MRRAIASWGAHVAEGAPRLRAYIYRLLAAFSNDQARGAAKPAIGQARPAAPFEPLSPQERRVLRLLAAGLSNPEIARELVVSTNTIKTQLQSIYRKLNVTSRAEAGEVARELKLV